MQECGIEGKFICSWAAVLLMTFASLFMQRDLGHLIATTSDLSMIPKTVIFSQTKDEVYKVFTSLSTLAGHKHSISMYHASQSEETKSFIQSTFRSPSSELRCLSATIAFGMVGIFVCPDYKDNTTVVCLI